MLSSTCINQESHAEGELLRSTLEEKKKEVGRVRQENLQMEERQEELEELRARVKALERRRTEMAEELDGADERRREAEEWWRSKVKEVERQKGTMQSTLYTEIQTQGELLKESRSKLQDSLRELEEARMELSRNRALLEEQKTFTIADREDSGEQRSRGSQEERGEVRVNTEVLCVLIEELLMSVYFKVKQEEIRRQLQQREAQVRFQVFLLSCV